MHPPSAELLLRDKIYCIISIILFQVFLDIYFFINEEERFSKHSEGYTILNIFVNC